jgi:drug/metabolite transporter (DMT)-like permease
MMGYLFIFCYVIIVGIATFLMKLGLKTINPYQLNFLMGLGMLVTGVPALLIADRSLKLPIKELPLGFSIGVMMAIGSLLYILAFNKLAAGIASVLAISYVLVVLILSIIFLKESVTLVKVFGAVLTLLGIGILTYKS